MMMHFRSAQSQLEAISQVVSILGDYKSNLRPGVLTSRQPARMVGDYLTSPSLPPVTWGPTFPLVTQWRSTKFTLC